MKNKTFIVVGVHILNGQVTSVSLESLLGGFNLAYLDELEGQINDIVDNDDLYDGESFDEIEGYVQLTLGFRLEHCPASNTHDKIFDIIDAYYTPYM
jgi:hypothetical protein